VLIGWIAARIISALPLIPRLTFFVWVFSLIFSIVAAVAVARSERYRYPISVRFLH